MIKLFKKLIKQILKTFDYRLIKISKNENLYDVLNFLFQKLDINILLDVGANVGQFGLKNRNAGYKKMIISFEPLKKAIDVLKKNSTDDNKWKYENIAIGDQDGETIINESNYSLSSSLLPISEEHLLAKENSDYIANHKVELKKLDTYIIENHLENDNIFLKIDTQGTEYDVLKGLDLNLDKIRGILCELTLTELYVGQKLWIKIIDHLEKKNFKIWFLEKGFQNLKTKKVLQIDCIFINRKYEKIIK